LEFNLHQATQKAVHLINRGEVKENLLKLLIYNSFFASTHFL
jgi:hypothetical protein